MDLEVGTLSHPGLSTRAIEVRKVTSTLDFLRIPLLDEMSKRGSWHSTNTLIDNIYLCKSTALDLIDLPCVPLGMPLSEDDLKWGQIILKGKLLYYFFLGFFKFLLLHVVMLSDVNRALSVWEKCRF